MTGRQTKQAITGLGVALSITIICTLLLITGCLLLLYGLYIWLVMLVDVPLAAGICGLTVIAVSLSILAIANVHRQRKQRAQMQKVKEKVLPLLLTGKGSSLLATTEQSELLLLAFSIGLYSGSNKHKLPPAGLLAKLLH